MFPWKLSSTWDVEVAISMFTPRLREASGSMGRGAQRCSVEAVIEACVEGIRADRTSLIQGCSSQGRLRRTGWLYKEKQWMW